VSQDTVVNLASQAITLGLSVAGPLLLASLLIGLVISVFQAVTQIQEQTLSLIPKIVGIVLVIVVLGPWMVNKMVTYTQNLYGSIPTLVGSGS
jgi:flagellar biosynthetic protein FliQ